MSTSDAAKKVSELETRLKGGTAYLGGAAPSDEDKKAFRDLLGDGNDGLQAWVGRMGTKAIVAKMEGTLKGGKPFLGGGLTPSAEDVKAFEEVLGTSNTALYRWVRNIASYTGEQRKAFGAPAKGKTTTYSLPAGKEAAAPKPAAQEAKPVAAPKQEVKAASPIAAPAPAPKAVPVSEEKIDSPAALTEPEPPQKDARKLVTRRIVTSSVPIPGADIILASTVDGWQVVTKVGEFKDGDPCLFFEIDSFLPASDSRFCFLKERSKHGGVEGFRLRTVKLRGVLSQGLALPLSYFPEVLALDPASDFSDILGVTKYEAPEGGGPGGKTFALNSRTYPSCIPRTDQERVQNIWRTVSSHLAAPYEVSMKLDGTSMTVYSMAGKVGVCSRNLDLDLSMEENSDNVYVMMARNSRLLAVLPEVCGGVPMALQGELMGPGIQGNREKLARHTFFLFNVYHITEKRFLAPPEREVIFAALRDKCEKGFVEHVPILHRCATLTEALRSETPTLAMLLAYAEGKSLSHAVREGLVFKTIDGKHSFKAISNAFLLKEAKT